MVRLERPLVIASDTHLGSHTGEAFIKDLERLIDAAEGADLLLAGDVFDLSLMPRRTAAAEALVGLVDRFPSLLGAFRRHLSRGGRVTLIPGNHDESTAEPEVRAALLSRLELTGDAPIETSPWFVRRNGIHIEHGHVYDPDNAPVHPLARWTEDSEPLGVALTRRFIATTGALHFAHAHDSTPAQAVLRAFRLYGVRAPIMIAQYFQTAAALVLEVDQRRSVAARTQLHTGSASLGTFAATACLPLERLEALLGVTPRPTHLSRRDVFMRLYFDRVFAALLAVGGVGAALVGSRGGVLMSLGATAYLVSSVAREKNRYTGLPEARLRDGAETVRRLTGAELVVFGHTHHEEEAPGYLNAGSFAFPRKSGRPFLHVSVDGAVSRRRSTDLT